MNAIQPFQPQERCLSIPLLIDNVDLGKSICARLNAERVIGLDCEGVNLGPMGDLTLVQISTPNGSIFVFDVCTSPLLVELLRGILESRIILKIVHDCRGERSNLEQQFGIHLRNVFDTQIAFHFLKPQTPERISLTNLSKYFRVPPNPHKREFNSDFYEANPGFWARRPLSPIMLSYAVADVANLHFFYAKMKNLQQDCRFKQSCDEANLSKSDIISVDGKRNANLGLFL